MRVGVGSWYSQSCHSLSAVIMDPLRWVLSTAWQPRPSADLRPGTPGHCGASWAAGGSDGRNGIGGRRAEGIAAGPAQGPHPAGPHRRRGAADRRGAATRASIQEITEEADIGFGSFYNHFDSKEQLFPTASEEVLERWGQLIDRDSAGLADRAELFAVARGSPGGWAGPTRRRRVLAAAGLDVLDIPIGLAPRALRDIQAGQAAGRSPSPTPRSRSAPWPAACSGSCGCASGTRNASPRPPSTSSPRPCCACSASR